MKTGAWAAFGAALAVFLVRYNLKMCGVDAELNSAGVIYFQPLGNRSVGKLVGEAMRDLKYSWPGSSDSVSSIGVLGEAGGTGL